MDDVVSIVPCGAPCGVEVIGEVPHLALAAVGGIVERVEVPCAVVVAARPVVVVADGLAEGVVAAPEVEIDAGLDERRGAGAAELIVDLVVVAAIGWSEG